MAFTFKSLFTKDDGRGGRQVEANGRLNLNLGIAPMPSSAPNIESTNPNSQAMQSEGNSPFATNSPGSPFEPMRAATPSPFEVAPIQQGGNSPFSPSGNVGAPVSPFSSATPHPAMQSPFTVAPPPTQQASPFEAAPQPQFQPQPQPQFQSQPQPQPQSQPQPPFQPQPQPQPQAQSPSAVGGYNGQFGSAGSPPQSPFAVSPQPTPFPGAASLAPNPRVQDLESKGFRPLSSLPGGSVPASARSSEGLSKGEGISATGGFAVAGPEAGLAPSSTPAGPPTQAIPSTDSSAHGVPAPALPAFGGNPPFPAQNSTLVQPQQRDDVGTSHQPPAGFPSLSDEPVRHPSSHASLTGFESGEEKIELSVREVLLDVSQEHLGFDPSRVPADVMARFPLSLLRPQLSMGRVIVKLSDVVDGCAEKYRPAFAKSNMESSVSLPIESIFHQLPLEVEKAQPAAAVPSNPFSFERAATPTTQIPAPEMESAKPFESRPSTQASPFGMETSSPPAGAFGSPAAAGAGLSAFETPFSGQAAADAGKALSDVQDSPPPGAVPAPSPFGLPSSAQAASPNFEPVAKPGLPWDAPLSPTSSIPSPTAFAGLPPLGGAPAGSPPPHSSKWPASDSPFFSEGDDEAAESSEHAVPPKSWDLSAPHGGSSFAAFGAPAFEDDAVESFESLGSAADEAAKSDLAHGNTFEPAAGFQAASFSDDKEQLSLRALFMSDERFDSNAVVCHCEALPGIDACVLLSTNGKIQASSGNGEGDFAVKASSMLGAVISLAEGLGLSDAENFSMRTDKGMVSFFKAEPVYLGVQHSNKGFAPGVQEKLSLASVELAKMAAS